MGDLKRLLCRKYKSETRLEYLVKQRTHDLQVQANSMRLMFDSTPDLMFCKDLNLNFTQCNRSFEQFFGLSAEEIIGKNNAEGLRFNQESAGVFDENERAVIAECRMFVVDEAVPRLDGTFGQFETVKVPLIVEGKVTGLHNARQFVNCRVFIRKMLSLMINFRKRLTYLSQRCIL